jgi:hypothetical protein
MWEWKKHMKETLADHVEGTFIVYNPEEDEAYLTTDTQKGERIIAEIRNGKVVGSKKPLEWWMEQLDRQYDIVEEKIARKDKILLPPRRGLYS